VATSKVLTTSRPDTLALHLTSGQVRIAVNPNATDVTVIVSTDDDDGPVADAVNGATVDTHSNRHDVRIPEPSPMVMSSGNSTFAFHGRVGFVAQSIQATNVFVGDRVNVNSTVVGGTAISRGEITVEVVLPPDAAVEFDTTSADFTAVGALRALNAHTISGSVTAETILGCADIRTIAGRVAIGQYQGCDARIATTSGEINVAAAGDLRSGRIKADSVSGSVRIANTRATGLTVHSSTVTGTRNVT
jgi:hypothetical protein